MIDEGRSVDFFVLNKSVFFYDIICLGIRIFKFGNI